MSPSSGFAFPAFLGFDFLDSIGTLAQRGKESNPLGLPDDTYTAIFGKFTHELVIQGVYYEPVAEGLVYKCTIHTTLVPAPSTVSLLVFGLLGLAVGRKRSWFR